MKNDDHLLMQQLFEKALTLPVDERIDFLTKETKGNNKLLNDVLELLDEDSNPSELLSDLDLTNYIDDMNFDYTGKVIDKYKVLKKIGEGGMGSVFLAERIDGEFDQQVALKIIHPGMNSISIVRKFHEERQILANLNHPKIARLYDGGVTKNHLPYFTMEYIDGIPVTEYCNKRKLTIKERLEMFLSICEAVKHAHQNLIIHRDLKPSNILITEEGDVKLLDFGIAKILTEENLNKDDHTKVLSLKFAAPEQLTGKGLTTATDVFSLGVLLYSLLADCNPLEKNKNLLTRDEEEIGSITGYLKDKSDVEKTSTAEQRGIVFEKLLKTLKGDLNIICNKAVRKTIEERYSSVEVMQHDIQNYFDGLPIHAGRQTLAYKMNKHIHRHRKGIGISAAVVIIISSIVFYYTVELKKERDQASLQAKKSERIAGFVINLFKISDPTISNGDSVTARSLLDNSVKRLDYELNEDPELQTEMFDVIGNVYKNLALYENAKELFEKSIVKKRENDFNELDVAKSLLLLGDLNRLNGDYVKSDSLYKKSLAIRLNHTDLLIPLVDENYYLMGILKHEIGEYDSSVYYTNKAKLIREKFYGKEHSLTIACIKTLAVIDYEKSIYDSAQAKYEYVLDADIKEHGENHINVADDKLLLAQVVRHKGNYKRADTLYNSALKIQLRILGEQHPDVAATYNHISRLYFNQGVYDTAEVYSRKSLSIRRKIYPPTHVTLIASMGSLASNLRAQNKFDEASKLYAECVRILEINNMHKHKYMGGIKSSLANVYKSMKNFNTAETQFIDAHKLITEILDENHIGISNTSLGLAEVYLIKKEYKKALPLLENAYRIRTNLLDDEHLKVLFSLNALSYCKVMLQNDRNSKKDFENSMQKILDERGNSSLRSKEIIERGIKYYLHVGDFNKAGVYRSVLSTDL